MEKPNPDWIFKSCPLNPHYFYSFPTWCQQWLVPWSWAPMWPPPPSGTPWLWSAPPSPTVDTTSPSCLLQSSMTSTTSSQQYFKWDLVIFVLNDLSLTVVLTFLLLGPGLIIVSGWWASWTGSTAQTVNSGRPNSTNVTLCSSTSPHWMRASLTHPRKASEDKFPLICGDRTQRSGI